MRPAAREPDPDLIAEDRDARRRQRSGCECDPAVPLICPGPAHCPYAGHDDDPETRPA